MAETKSVKNSDCEIDLAGDKDQDRKRIVQTIFR